MVAIDRVPPNLNYLSIIGFQMILHRAPHVEFFVQNATIPSIDLPPIDVPNQFVTLPFHGDHISYAPLTVDIIMDENLEGYQELHSWLTGLGFPENFEQHAELVRNDQDEFSHSGLYSDLSLTVVTSLKNMNVQFNFRDAMITALSGWEMTHTAEDVQYAVCTATFRYGYFQIEIIRA